MSDISNLANQVCTFCDFESDEIDPRVLYRSSDDFGILGNVEHVAYMSDCNERQQPSIVYEDSYADADNRSSKDFSKYIPINFCPFCGRRLV